jgi:hypothetical protein
MLTDDEIKALLEGCEGVTPGPWQLLGWGPMGLYGKGDLRDAEYIARFRADLIEDGNAAHIARCDPETIAELCARLLDAEARVKVLEEALAPFSLFFKSEKHDLSPAKDHTIVASFLDQDTKLPLAELTIADFRKAAQESGI